MLKKKKSSKKESTICKIPIKIVAEKSLGYHLVIDVIFNNITRGRLIIDTGASHSVFDSTLMENICTPIINNKNSTQAIGVSSEKIENSLAKIPEFQIGDLYFKNYKIVLINLDHVNQYYEQLAGFKIFGLLGGDFLKKHKAIIDYPGKKLILQ